MKNLFVLNSPPYGSERAYNALRLAMSLAVREGEAVRVFLMGDAVTCGVAGQKTPDGYYNVERMIRGTCNRGAEAAACGSCMDARGLLESALCAGVRRGTLEELTDWTVWADRVLTF